MYVFPLKKLQNDKLTLILSDKSTRLTHTDMYRLELDSKPVTLVDQIEDKLLNYFKANDLGVGSVIPNEIELAGALGVGRSALREALSRLKMMGLIETRTRRGMILKEPTLLGAMKRVIDPRILSENTLFDLLDFRVALEVGISSDIFYYITSEEIDELDKIVRMGEVFSNNEYPLISEYMFHSKLYEITRNRTIAEFQEIIHPVLTFINDKFKVAFEPINIELERQGKLVSHSDLLELIKAGDEQGYKQAIEQHFMVYKTFLRNRK